MGISKTVETLSVLKRLPGIRFLDSLQTKLLESDCIWYWEKQWISFINKCLRIEWYRKIPSEWDKGRDREGDGKPWWGIE